MFTEHVWMGRLLLAGMLLTPMAAAHAQDSPLLAVAGAAGVALPLHADVGTALPEWQVTLRARVSRRAAIEGFYDEWRDSSSLEQFDVPISGRGGLIGRAGRITARNRLVMRTAGMAGLATGTFARVTISGGGGSGWIQYSRVNRTRAQDCQPALDFCLNESRLSPHGPASACTGSSASKLPSHHDSASSVSSRRPFRRGTPGRRISASRAASA